jgi:hypothetical protein
MSSTLRSYAQIPARVKYFIYDSGSATTDVAVPAVSIFTLPVGAYASLSSKATADEVNDVANTDPSSPATSLLKDMGRQITIYDDTTSAHVAIYREVQVVNGADTEGVGGSSPAWGSNYFVKVWSANGLGVAVVRTG